MEKYIEFAPIIIVVLLFLLQANIVVTPAQLEKKHREILADAEKKFNSLDDKYVSLPAYLGFREEIKEDMKEVKAGINDIKNFLITNKGDL